MLTRVRAVLLVTFAAACGGTGGTPTAPTPTAPSLTVTVLSGHVTDRATGAPIAGSEVVASYPDVSRAFAWATADNYESDVHYVRSASQDFRLYPIQRIAAGDSTVVTVEPNDPLCNNNLSSPGWGADYVCRIVRVRVPVDGTLTLEALPIAGGARPLLEVEAGLGATGLLLRTAGESHVDPSHGRDRGHCPRRDGVELDQPSVAYPDDDDEAALSEPYTA